MEISISNSIVLGITIRIVGCTVFSR